MANVDIVSTIENYENTTVTAKRAITKFAPDTDMDRERLRLSHMENGTYYVHICDKRHYHIFCCNMFVFACPIRAKESRR
jgi:hypothetical protein